MVDSLAVSSWTWVELRQQMEGTIVGSVEGARQMGRQPGGDAGLHRGEDG